MIGKPLWPVALCVAVAFPGTLVAQAGRADVAEGNRLYGEERFEEARERYLEALRKAPNSPLIRFNDANALYQTAEFQRAMEAYQRALESDDPALQANAWYNLGNAFYRQQQLEESLESYKQALRLNPGDVDAKHNLETVLEMMQQQQQQQQDQDQQDQDEENQEQDQQQQQGDEEQDEQQQDQQPQDPDEQESEEEQQPQSGESESPREMSREEAERLLEAIDEDPSEIKRKVQPVSGVRVVKKW
jgi:tetratricopeptide (TPR) repeat protein